MKKPRRKSRAQTTRAAAAMASAVAQPVRADRAGTAMRETADWHWRHGAHEPSTRAAPGARAKGPPPGRSERAANERRRAQAAAYRAAGVTRQPDVIKLAPHLVARVAARPVIARESAPPLSEQFGNVESRLRSAVVRERGAFAALVLPIVLLIGALIGNVALTPRIKSGAVGAAIAALDQRMLEPGPAVRALAVAKAEATDRAIIAALPEFPLVAALPPIAPAGRLVAPELKLALTAPGVPPLAAVDSTTSRAPDIQLPPMAYAAVAPKVDAPQLPSVVDQPVILALPVPPRLPDGGVAREAEVADVTAATGEQCRRPLTSAATIARDAARSVLAASSPDDSGAFGRALAVAAEAQIGELAIYNARYVRIAYPRGDVTTQFGVCSDVVIRAYRALDIDLQELVHLSRPGTADANIDHRRTEMLRAFLAQHGTSLPPSPYSEDFLPGDIVTYYRPQNRSSTAHIGIVSTAIAPSGRPMIVHNRGWGVQLEDALFVDHMTGHYRFRGLSAQAVASLPKSARIAVAAQRLGARVADAKVGAAKTPPPVAAAAPAIAADGAVSGVAAAVVRQSRPSTVLTDLPTPMGLGVRPGAQRLR